MKIDITVTMRSGNKLRIAVEATSVVQIAKELNKGKFVRFGPVILNIAEIESVVQDGSCQTVAN